MRSTTIAGNHHFQRTPSPTPVPFLHHHNSFHNHYENQDGIFAVSPNKKGILSACLVASVISFPFALKAHFIGIICVISIIATIKLYFELEHEATVIATRMKNTLSASQIKKALKTPPSPEFDEHVRVKVRQMMQMNSHK